jgi:hypothetical protein
MDKITLTSDHVYTKKVNLDLDKIKVSSYTLHKLVKEKFFNPTSHLDPNAQLDHKVWSKYNLLLYPLDGFHELYNEIKTMFHECNKDPFEQYYIQSWVNFYYHNDFIEWHTHGPEEHHGWHGFFCVDCEPSYTAYMVKNQPEIFRIPSIDNQIVLSKSGNDKHRTAPWPDKSRPRITIAFDIFPKEFIKFDEYLNHWIPI